MLRPLLLLKIGLGGLTLAARMGQNGQRARQPADLETPEPVRKNEPAESAGAFFRRHLEQELSGQFGRSWDELHPSHQQVVSRERYARCRSELFARAGAPAGLEAFEVVSAVDAPIDAVGIPGAVSTAVTVRIRIGGNGAVHTSSETLHAIRVDGRWSWILPESVYRAYEAGSRPGG